MASASHMEAIFPAPTPDPTNSNLAASSFGLALKEVSNHQKAARKATVMGVVFWLTYSFVY